MSTPKPHSTVATRMSGIREDWLRLTQEEVLEPDLAIVDPHHHLWGFPSHRYLLPDFRRHRQRPQNRVDRVYRMHGLLPRRRSTGAAHPGRDRVRQRRRRHVGERRLWPHTGGGWNRRPRRPDDRRPCRRGTARAHGRCRPALQGPPHRWEDKAPGCTTTAPIRRLTSIAPCQVP